VLAAGVAAYAAEVCITLGFARVGQNVLGQVSVLKFLSPIFALLWGVVFLGERPAWHVLVGAVLVLCPAAFVAYDRQAAVKQQGSEDQADECGTSRTLENEGRTTHVEQIEVIPLGARQLDFEVDEECIGA